MSKVENLSAENDSSDRKNDSTLNPFLRSNHLESKIVFLLQFKPTMVSYENYKPLQCSVSALKQEWVLDGTHFFYSVTVFIVCSLFEYTKTK